MYCTWSGRSRPLSASKRAIACGVASMPSAALAAEPGTRLMVTKRPTDAANGVATNPASRTAISRSMGSSTRRGGPRRHPAVVQLRGRTLALEPRVLERLQESGAHRFVVLQLLRVGD